MIDLRNKCGSCSHFKLIDGTCNGECLRNPYGANVVHDPKHPYWIVARSRMKCKDYNRPPMTNADRIRAMSDEELAEFLYWYCPYDEAKMDCEESDCDECVADWLKQPYKEDAP